MIVLLYAKYLSLTFIYTNVSVLHVLSLRLELFCFSYKYFN